MEKDLLHTPEGVRDIYNEECEKKIILQNKLCESINSYGYHIMQTPSFEFFDIFSKEIGTTASKELFKFFDHEGNTLVLRPDITPSIARAAAKYFMDETMPIRLYYNGNTFINNASYKGMLKEVTQIGAELIGDDSVMADAEMIAMTVDALRACGLKDFQISIGHAGYFSALVDAVGLDDDTVEELRESLANKNFFRLDEIISNLNLTAEAKELFNLLSGFHGDVEEIRSAKLKSLGSSRIKESLQRIIDMDDVLKIYGIDKYVSYELGNVTSYNYYTGIIFAAYTYGTGQPVVKGGRYNNLLSHFGKNAPATGFAVVVDQLMAALSRQNIEVPVKRNCELVCFDEKNKKKAVQYASEQRAAGKYVELMPMNFGKDKTVYENYGNKNICDKITFMEGE